MLRLVGYFKLGYVTASLFISKLQSYPRQNNLTYVLQQYGQLIKTIYILRYLQSKPLRRKVHAQLNKGECLHALRCFLWFGGDGSIRRKQEEDQQEVVSCLNVITNIIVVWNTVYMQEIIHQLKKEGYPFKEEELQQLSPARYEHINRMGKYTFQVSEELLPNGLRPLRKTKPTSNHIKNS
jgi:TnpA family transposase